jgi:hypothetical protein
MDLHVSCSVWISRLTRLTACGMVAKKSGNASVLHDASTQYRAELAIATQPAALSSSTTQQESHRSNLCYC